MRPAARHGVTGILVVAFAANGCGGDKKAPATSGAGNAGASAGLGQAAGGASGAAGGRISGGSGGSSAGSSAGSMSPGAGGEAGAGGAAGCQLLRAGESGPHGLTQVYAAKNQGNELVPLGIDGDQVYFEADAKVFALPAA